MQCYEYLLMRQYLVWRAQASGVRVALNDPRLEDMLDEQHIGSLDALLALGEDKLAIVLEPLVGRVPKAA